MAPRASIQVEQVRSLQHLVMGGRDQRLPLRTVMASRRRLSLSMSSDASAFDVIAVEIGTLTALALVLETSP
jgi:hypothetical protein